MKLKGSEIKIISQNSADFPQLLKEIPNSPLQIYAIGTLPNEKNLCVSIVGTRKATTEGKIIAKKIAQKLAELEIIIVSGLAMGIDTAAHEGALSVNGKTVAVLACGLNTIYPRQNENLAKKIVEFGGAITSEYAPDAPILPYQFLERNRIVSGLSVATIVVESPTNSGALVTARLAAEQGREVFVFPGSINHQNYRGSHKLIRDGARLIASIEDIIEDLGLKTPDCKTQNSNEPKNFKFKNDERIVFETLKKIGCPANIDKIIELTKLEPQVVNQSLAVLIIQEIISETEGGYSI